MKPINYSVTRHEDYRTLTVSSPADFWQYFKLEKPAGEASSLLPENEIKVGTRLYHTVFEEWYVAKSAELTKKGNDKYFEIVLANE